jgi:hypothetical protein
MAVVAACSGAALLGLTGCGVGAGFLSKPPANYTITVTATSGPAMHTATSTLNLQ